MAEEDLEVGEAVEHAGEREPEELHAGLVVPADAVGGERVVDGVAEARVQRGPHPRLRDLRVDVQRGAQRRGGLEDRPVVGVVEVALTGAAEEQGTVEAELGDRALELLRGCGGRGGGEGGEALEPVRVGVHELGDAVVRLDLQAGGLVGREVVQAGRGERDHLDVEPRLVHRRDPALSDLAEPLAQLPRRDAGPRVIARGGVEPAPRRHDLVGDEVLLGADRLHLSACLLSVPSSLIASSRPNGP